MTKKAAITTTKSPSGNTPLVLGTLGTDALNTTWRIAFPVLASAIAGLAGDKTLHTAPWLTLFGLLVGFVIAGLLLARQLAAIEREDHV